MTKNLLKSFLLISLGILLIASVSAATQTYSEWSDRSNSATIINGQSINFNAGFYASSPMTINLKLYTSSYQLVHTFENNKVINTITNPSSFYKYKFSNTYTITPSLYGTTGSYFIKLSSTDTAGSQSEYTLYLTVTPYIPVEENNAPVITSIAVKNVDEGEAYTYDVQATDADSDTLIYSLTQKPNWMSINSATGLITGTAPFVGSDSPVNILVQVSDGTDTATQSFTLIVNDVSANNAPVITSTAVTEVNEGNSYSYTVTATDEDGDTLTYSLTQNPLGFTIDSVTGLVSGTAPSVSSDADYTITVRVSDGTDYDEQSFTLTVDNTGSSNNGRSGGSSGGIRYIETSQPSTKRFSGGEITTPPVKKTTGMSITTFFYIIICVIILGIILVTFALVKNLRDKENKKVEETKYRESYY